MLISLDLSASLTVNESGTQGAGSMIDRTIPPITDKDLSARYQAVSPRVPPAVISLNKVAGNTSLKIKNG